jgi:hypothetical protein
LGGRFVIASEGKSVTQIAHTATCIVMRAQASGQPPPITCEIANNTHGTNERSKTTAAARRHVLTGFGDDAIPTKT